MSGANSVVYDTSAIIEFFLGTQAGNTVKKFLEDKNSENVIPSVVLCELASKLKRIGVNPAEFISLLEENAIIPSLDREVAKQAGLLHAELKTKDASISMIDCVIIIHAEMHNAMIISKDYHFKLYKNANII